MEVAGLANQNLLWATVERQCSHMVWDSCVAIDVGIHKACLQNKSVTSRL